MPTYRNTDVHRRYWPGISRQDGSTLELDPGEEVTLDDAVEAAFLEDVDAPKETSIDAAAGTDPAASPAATGRRSKAGAAIDAAAGTDPATTTPAPAPPDGSAPPAAA